MAEDRRVRKTKKAIQDAFCELTKEKKVNEISVKELCAKADLNKSTFYLHYKDIYDLADSIQGILTNDVCAIIEEYSCKGIIEKVPEMWIRIAEKHFKNSNDLGMLLRRPGMISMVRAFETALVDTIMKKFIEAGIEEGTEQYFQHHLDVTFVVNGYVGILREFDVTERESAMVEVSKRLSTGFFVEIEGESCI